jgi:hypothetical protein
VACAVWPCVTLFHALLQGGKDPDAARRVLLDVPGLDPQNGDARHSLEALQARRGQPP